MKKLFASLLAATMVAGMAVSAFAYTDDKDKTAIAGLDDYSLATAVYYYDGDTNLLTVKADDQINGGKKVYYPILVGETVYDDTATANGAAKYTYADKASEVEDLKAKVKATVNGKYIEKETNIVRKEIATGKKVYCVEVKTADFYGTDESEIEFDITLYNKGRKEATTEDLTNPTTAFTLGKDAYYIDLSDATDGANLAGNDADNAVRGLYKVKFNKNELSMKVLPEADAVSLEDAKKIDGAKEDIETISLDFTKANATFDVAASSQESLYLGYSTDANKAIVLANPDAEIDFVDFDANPTFDFTGTLKLNVEDPDKTYFCYEIVDGKLNVVGKYNADDECFDVRTRTLGSYALSDKELVNAKTDEEKPAEEKPVDPTTPDKQVPTGAIA